MPLINRINAIHTEKLSSVRMTSPDLDFPDLHQEVFHRWSTCPLARRWQPWNGCRTKTTHLSLSLCVNTRLVIRHKGVALNWCSTNCSDWNGTEFFHPLDKDKVTRCTDCRDLRYRCQIIIIRMKSCHTRIGAEDEVLMSKEQFNVYLCYMNVSAPVWLCTA